LLYYSNIISDKWKYYILNGKILNTFYKNILIEITSPRLTLIPLDNRLLTVWHEKNRAELEKLLKLNPNNWENIDPLTVAETADALENFWIPQTNLNPENFYWYTNWEIILTEKNISIGGIGFAGYPENGETMVGYMIDQKFQNQGIASEALDCLLNWAFMDPVLQTVNADTPKDNLPSQKVLLKNSFIQTGEGQVEHTQTMKVFHWAKSRI
jgi:[ribosomal protein S5]-alanine N-acetyltransferase